MNRRFYLLLGIIGVLPVLVGADQITLSAATPNPNNLSRTIKEEGSYLVDPQRTLDHIIMKAKDPVTNVTSVMPAATGMAGGIPIWWGTSRIYRLFRSHTIAGQRSERTLSREASSPFTTPTAGT